LFGTPGSKAIRNNKVIMDGIFQVVVCDFTALCVVHDEVTKLKFAFGRLQDATLARFKVPYHVFHYVAFAFIRGGEARDRLVYVLYHFD
jgi:hypothetical protein